MTDAPDNPLDSLLEGMFLGQERLSRDEIYRRAVAADLPASDMARVDTLPEGEYSLDEVAEVLQADVDV
ncbi:MAG TPA: hypothetical protein VES42_08645 [Pilimelia sp.]|nr:hypothetical protein [Pilimelia sp.]